MSAEKIEVAVTLPRELWKYCFGVRKSNRNMRQIC
jgi:hypothetical protein